MFNLSNLSAVIALLVTLSVAAERLVEIIKNLPWLGQLLSTEWPGAIAEGVRRIVLQMLAAGAGIFTAWLALGILPVIPGTEINGNATPAGVVTVLGLLASGGSGFWTAVLGYLGNIKAIKQDEAVKTKVQAAAVTVAVAEGRLPPAASLPVMRSLAPGAPVNLTPSSDAVQNAARKTLARALAKANATL